MTIELKNYLNDGSNWQARCVLSILQYNIYSVLNDAWNEKYHTSDAHIFVGRYENCREQGYVFSLCYKTKQKHYAVYEHRNSDDIIVLISNKVTTNTPNVDDMWEEKGTDATKYCYDKDFRCGEFEKCAEYIIDDMREQLAEWMGNK